MSISGIGNQSQSFYERTSGKKSDSKESGNEFNKRLSDKIEKNSGTFENSKNADQIYDSKSEYSSSTSSKSSSSSSSKSSAKSSANSSSNSEDTIDSKWDEAMLKYSMFVEDRIKNGPQKFQIGGSEMSIEQWDKLIKKVDGDLDDIKEDLKERSEEIKKAEAEKNLEDDSKRKEDIKIKDVIKPEDEVDPEDLIKSETVIKPEDEIKNKDEINF